MSNKEKDVRQRVFAIGYKEMKWSNFSSMGREYCLNSQGANGNIMLEHVR